MGDGVGSVAGSEFHTPAPSAVLSGQARAKDRRRHRGRLDCDSLVSAWSVRLRALVEAGCQAGDLPKPGAFSMTLANVSPRWRLAHAITRAQT